MPGAKGSRERDKITADPNWWVAEVSRIMTPADVHVPVPGTVNEFLAWQEN